jgi:hypothetical protein
MSIHFTGISATPLSSTGININKVTEYSLTEIYYIHNSKTVKVDIYELKKKKALFIA